MERIRLDIKGGSVIMFIRFLVSVIYTGGPWSKAQSCVLCEIWRRHFIFILDSPSHLSEPLYSTVYYLIWNIFYTDIDILFQEAFIWPFNTQNSYPFFWREIVHVIEHLQPFSFYLIICLFKNVSYTKSLCIKASQMFKSRFFLL